jgi:hypothetical protein
MIAVLSSAAARLAKDTSRTTREIGEFIDPSKNCQLFFP